MSAADGAPVAVGPMASMSWYSRPAEGQGVIGRLGCIGETCFKEIRFRNGCQERETYVLRGKENLCRYSMRRGESSSVMTCFRYQPATQSGPVGRGRLRLA